jgi:glycoprotein endo-alpha-1,2-mannosidase
VVRIHDRPFLRPRLLPCRIRGLVLAALIVATLVAAGRAAAQPLTVGAYYYPWYGVNGAQWDRGFVRSELDPPELPLLGEYDSSAPAVIAQHYAWAQSYGVDVFFCSWAGPGSYDDGVIRNDLLPSPARGPTQISILYESLQRLPVDANSLIQIDDAAIATMVSDFDYLARTYLTQPGYLRIDGRPVVVIYASRIFRGKVAQAIRAIRTHLEAVYGFDPYLIGDEVDWDRAPNRARIRLYDAITGYTPYSRNQPAGWPDDTGYVVATEERMRQFRAVAASLGVGFIPTALPGFDDLGVRPEDAHHVLPRALGPGEPQDSTFTSSLALAGTLVDPSLDLLTVTSWNEWNEDSQIEPTAPALPTAAPFPATQDYPFDAYGFAMLDRLRTFELGWEQSPWPQGRGMFFAE